MIAITNKAWPDIVKLLTEQLLHASNRVPVPTVHQLDVTEKPEWVSRELQHVSLQFFAPKGVNQAQDLIEPNLPWVEEHFQERVGGLPLNPPPSHERWPFARTGNAEHLTEAGKFSHTYPERVWPRFANVEGCTPEGRQIFVPHVGLRFEYGDLNDLIKVLVKDPLSRQAYLPIWFPEDLAATAHHNARVPCTLGYHFLQRRGELDVTYYLRSCDFVRYFKDDVYMAVRLGHWVRDQLNGLGVGKGRLDMGKIIVHITSLHCFEGDVPFLRKSL